MSDKQEALIEILDTMERHGLTLADVSAALNDKPGAEAAKSGGIISRLFGYIGGIFIFSGLAIYVSMQWDDLGSAGRVLLTLGPGFCTFIMALTCLTDKRLERAATPLFLVAALLQPVGILVALREYAHGDNPEHGVLFMCLVMLLQQGLVFIAKRRTVLALTTTFFGASFFATAFDLMDFSDDLIGFVIGLSLCCIAWAMNRSVHKPVSAITYFFGAVMFLYACWHQLHNGPFYILFLGLSCGTIFISTLARSRTLLLVGTLSLMGYLGDFIYDHFGHNIGAPIALMLAGVLMLGLGAMAWRINNKYISQKG
ncbi:MAG: DUF2157 domain-containing protein [Alphaproteobacteria bacterium]|nr:DUF2157 domain-containing protein [Alphaproteobacteria bacterium]